MLGQKRVQDAEIDSWFQQLRDASHMGLGDSCVTLASLTAADFQHTFYKTSSNETRQNRLIEAKVYGRVYMDLAGTSCEYNLHFIVI